MALAEASDLAALLGGDVDVDETRAGVLLELASGVIVAETGQTFEKVTGDEARLRGTWTEDIWLPQRPVTGVSEVRLTGLGFHNILIPQNAYTWSRDGLLRIAAPAFVNFTGDLGVSLGYWGGTNTIVTVTYDHGFEEIPAQVRYVCLSFAAQIYTHPDAGLVSSETFDGEYSVAYAAIANRGLPADLCRVLRRYERKNYTVPTGIS